MVSPTEVNWSNQGDQKRWTLRTVIINETQITSITPCDQMMFLLAQGKLPDGLHESQQFSKINLIDGREIIVVGPPAVIGEKVRKVLHG